MNTKTLQKNLNKLGFYCGLADGVNGKRTKAAVKRFQQAWNLGKKLKADKIAGGLTIAALEKTLANGNRLSKNFKASEFRCKCAGKYSDCLGVRVRRADLIALEKLRNAYPSGLRIVSAYRCKRHNRAVGGASKSQHLTGRAFDIPQRLKVNDKRIPARFRGRGYAGKLKLVRHVDSRSIPARWKY